MADLKAELESLGSSRPAAIHEQIVEVARDVVPNDFGLLFRLTGERDTPSYSIEVGDGHDDVREVVDRFDGQEALGAPYLPPNSNVAPRNAFIRARQHFGAKRFEQSGAQRKAFGPLDVTDQLRAMFFDGNELLGWVGLLRRSEQVETFRPHERRQLNDAAGEIKSALAAARALERDLLGDDLAATCGPDGSVRHATKQFARWLDDDRRSYLSRRVEAFDTNGRRGGTETIGGTEIRLTRLDAGDGTRYLATVDRAELWKLAPEHLLTPRQNEIADFARVGATNREIADTLDISKNTVKQHLKNIYRRLGIGSRAELANLLRG